jgi:hypothetical protein
MSPDQIASFHRDGFVAVERVTSDDDVVFLRQILDRLFAAGAGRADGNQFDLAGTDEDESEHKLSQIMHPANYAPELNDSFLVRRASDALSELLGTRVRASIFHAINKPARHGAATPWHQDAAYWDPRFVHRKVSMWVPLQEVTVENGCMQFVPTANLQDVLPHRSINNDPRIHGLELVPNERRRIDSRATPCPLPAGGATFHGGYTPHYAGPNTTDSPRRAIILEAELPPVVRESPLHFPWQEARRTARMERMKD